MKFIHPIYWKCKHFKQEAEQALKTNAEYFKADEGFKLVPFNGTRTDKVHSDMIIWNRDQIKIALKYQN